VTYLRTNPIAEKGILPDEQNIWYCKEEQERKKPEWIQQPRPAIVVEEIWQTRENLKPVLGLSGGIFLARLALSEISRETVSTWMGHKHATESQWAAAPFHSPTFNCSTEMTVKKRNSPQVSYSWAQKNLIPLYILRTCKNHFQFGYFRCVCVCCFSDKDLLKQHWPLRIGLKLQQNMQWSSCDSTTPTVTGLPAFMSSDYELLLRQTAHCMNHWDMWIEAIIFISFLSFITA
jgi:hypothetical protein